MAVASTYPYPVTSTLLVQILLPSTCSAANASFDRVIFNPISIFHVAYPICSDSEFHSHLFHNIFELHPLNVARPSQGICLHPFHHSTFHSTCSRPQATSFIHCFIALTALYCHIVSPHAPLR